MYNVRKKVEGVEGVVVQSYGQELFRLQDPLSPELQRAKLQDSK
jgi:hypothetical protein